MTTTPVPLLVGINPPGNSFVLPDHKMVYISVTKVACTSLRWMVADLGGEDLQSFYSATGPHQSRLMTIHRARSNWNHSPQLGALAPELLEDISRDRGWFIFAVVRDPWSRLWSAWQSKFLVRHTPYVRRFIDEPWFPRIPEKPSDVVEDFRSFVEAAPWTSNADLAKDVHFLPQTRSVRPRHINYTKIYDLHDMSSLIADVTEHLKTVRREQELYLPRANEMPLPMTSQVLEGGVREEIERLYAADFDVFGERWNFHSLRLAPDGWSPDAIRHAQSHVVANERIGDLTVAARQLRRQLDDARVQQAKPEDSVAPWRRWGQKVLGR